MLTFTEQVFSIVRKIPKGKVMTYQEVAYKIGRPGAARAVGTALSKNYDPQIPCHRVIRTDGGMGGYNRGLKNKIKILKKEGALK
ncbi:MAG: MGMT family protein [Patescibacteria group bacterium]